VAITFWLAVLKTGGLSPPSSSTMRRMTSPARRQAAPPSPQATGPVPGSRAVVGDTHVLLQALPLARRAARGRVVEPLQGLTRLRALQGDLQGSCSEGESRSAV